MGYLFDKTVPYISENKAINTDHMKSFVANIMILSCKRDQESNKYSASLPGSILRPSECMADNSDIFHKIKKTSNESKLLKGQISGICRFLILINWVIEFCYVKEWKPVNQETFV